MGAPKSDRHFLTTQEVAHMLQISDSLLRERLPAMQANDGFPMEMPYQKRPKLFNRAAVERWLERASGMTMQDIEEAECLGLTVADIHVLAQARRRA